MTKRTPLEAGYKIDLAEFKPKPWHRRSKVLRWSTPAFAVDVACEARDTDGFLYLRFGGHQQTILMTSQPRHYGGQQWYLVCPDTGQLVRIVWMPPGTDHFAGRTAWGRRVAYLSQFEGTAMRARVRREQLAERLGADPTTTQLPPRPKHMRQTTYEALAREWVIAKTVTARTASTT